MNRTKDKGMGSIESSSTTAPEWAQQRLNRLRMGCLLFALLVIAGIVLLFRHLSVRLPQEPFDSEAWKEYVDRTQAYSEYRPTVRQRMIKDLVLSVLPGRSRQEIEQLLGRSITPEKWQRKGMPGHYFDEHEWDLIYEIGTERCFIWDHRGYALSPDPEFLIIRLDANGIFSSWYIAGAARWRDIAGDQGAQTYSKTRLTNRLGGEE